MYLHFEDWTEPMFLQQIEDKGMPHGGRIIKVISSDVDPRAALGRSSLTIVEKSGDVFAPVEEYSYQGRGTFTGDQLEDRLALYGLNQIGERTIRSLFRFSNAKGFCQAAMAAKKSSQEWLIRHPFQDIDGIHLAKDRPLRQRLIHLDIFFPESLEELRQTVDFDNPDVMVENTQWIRWLRKDPTLRRKPS